MFLGYLSGEYNGIVRIVDSSEYIDGNFVPPHKADPMFIGPLSIYTHVERQVGNLTARCLFIQLNDKDRATVRDSKLILIKCTWSFFRLNLLL